MKRSYKTIFSIIAVSVLLSACTSNEASRTEPVTTTTGAGTTTSSPAASVAERDYAFLRVVHAVPGAGAVDVVTDKETPFTGAAYKQVTPYAEVHSEQQNIRIVPGGSARQANAQQLANNREIMSAGHHYTALIVPNSGGDGITLRMIDDNITPPDAGKAKVRVIHASPDAGEVDVYAKGNNKALFSGVNYQSATGYETVDPMTATIEVRPEGQQRAVLTIPSARFEANKIYTVIVTGKAKGTPKLEATVIQDELTGARGAGAMMPAATPTATATPVK